MVWRHRKTGANIVWKSGDYALRQSLDTVADPTWRIAALGDYDGDRRADLFWHNTATGVNVIWKAAQAATRVMSASSPADLAGIVGTPACARPATATSNRRLAPGPTLLPIRRRR